MRPLLRILTILLVSAGLTACYHPDIQQGNILTPAQIQQIHLGMSQSEVEEVLGQPILDNAFSDDQLTYVYSNWPNHGDFVEKKLILLFHNDRLIKIENDYR